MGETVTLKIPLVMDSEGNWSANGAVGEDEPDWSFMYETVWLAAGEHYNPKVQYWVNVEVPLPSIAILSGKAQEGE